MPVREGLIKLPAHKPAGDASNRAKGHDVLDIIADQRSLHAVAHLGLNAMAMPKLRKGPPNLLIAKVAVPHKFGDADHPAHTPGNPADGIKADENLRSNAGGHAAKAPGWI